MFLQFCFCSLALRSFEVLFNCKNNSIIEGPINLQNWQKCWMREWVEEKNWHCWNLILNLFCRLRSSFSASFVTSFRFLRICVGQCRHKCCNPVLLFYHHNDSSRLVRSQPVCLCEKRCCCRCCWCCCLSWPAPIPRELFFAEFPTSLIILGPLPLISSSINPIILFSVSSNVTRQESTFLSSNEFHF